MSGAYSLMGQTKEEEVMKVVNRLFEGMKLGDSTIVRDVFSPEARLVTISNRDGQPRFRIGSVDRFVTAVGTPHDEDWIEIGWDEVVQIDGELAQVWTKYALYVGETFSHCGVDAFQLFKGEDGWKIFQLTDTRQSSDCELPPEKD